MELCNPNLQDIKAYRQIMLQHGSGYDGDGYYIYSQDGRGIGSFLGGLVKSALPVITRAIKTGANVAKPHLKKAASDVVTAGSKRLISKLSSDIVKTTNRPNKRRRKRI